MTQRDLVFKLLKHQKGILSSREAKKAGVAYKTLQRMHQDGEIDKLNHGLYMDPDLMEDPYLVAQYRCKKCVFSHETSLFFHELTDRTPFRLMMTIPSGFNTRLIKEKKKYKFFYITEELHSLGKTSTKTPYGQEIKIYDKERTLCDCINKIDYLDRDLVKEAIKRYFSTPGVDYATLLRYSEIFNIRQTVRQYMEMLT